MENNNDFQEWMQGWMERFMSRFDRLDEFMEIMSGRHNIMNGERYLDNQDLCQLLNVSKRTLQRYRSLGVLPYQNIYHKTYYREKDVEAFIKEHFAKNEKPESPDDIGSDPEDTDSP